MSHKMIQHLDAILYSLFVPYRERVPDVKKVSDAMVEQGLISHEKEVVNDHIAFRTLGLPNLGIASLERIFLYYGYTRKSFYFFEQKKLNAFWYEPPSGQYPRIFISELRVNDLSRKAQDIITKYVKDVVYDPVEHLVLENPDLVAEFFVTPLWQLPTLADYSELLEESEYAAWVIYNRYYLNHYTISVHELPGKYGQLEHFNEFLESIGITLNTSGGKIKTSNDGLLKQSSTVANMIDTEFAHGKKMKISGSYVEFAERLVLPEFKNMPANELTRKHRREGFETGNADKIFESTYLEQVTKAGSGN